MDARDIHYIGSYEEMIAEAVGLIRSAAEKIKGRDAVGRLYRARLDVEVRIGKIMEEISTTETRKEVEHDRSKAGEGIHPEQRHRRAGRGHSG